MAIWTRKHNRATFPQQGRTIGWLAWAFITLLALFGLQYQALAAPYTLPQATFATTAVNVTSAPVPVTVTLSVGGTPGTAGSLTEGVSASGVAEFAVVSPNTGTCFSATFNVNQTCTVAATFTPRFPGLRHGAIQLKASDGTVLGTALISGIGSGGLPVLIPGEINTVAGDENWFYQSDNVPATKAPIQLPSGLIVDGAGNLYLADTINYRVRRVDAVSPHNITTVAGNGSAGPNGDNGPATSAQLTGPSGLAMDGAGNLFIADTGNNTIRRVDAITQQITTVAGTVGQASFGGDGGPATSAYLNAPQGIALLSNGDLIIADTGNARIRLVTMSDGRIQTIAGTGTPGSDYDNGPAVSAELNKPTGVAVAADGTIAVADLGNNRVRLFTIGGNLSTVAGVGSGGYTGDGGSARLAELQGPSAVAFDPAGDLFIADSLNNCIRLVSGRQGVITTLAGTPTDDRFAGDLGPDNAARMHGPSALFFDASGNLWIADRFNNRIREVNGSLLTVGPYPDIKMGKTSQPVAEQLMNAGNSTLTLASPVLQQAKLDTASTTCGQSPLAAADFCNMGLVFAPQNVGPRIDGYITWTSDAPNVTPVDDLYGKVLDVNPTSVALVPNMNPGLLGQPLTLTATVTSDDTGRTGTVDFVEGNTTYCPQVPLAADGTATCVVSGLSMGTHTLLANYTGDANNAASQGTLSEVIKQQAALALSVSSSPAVVTSNITLTLRAADANGTPTGTVVFYDGQTALATETLDSSGNASWSTSAFTVGNHSLSAQYSGDGANVAGSTPPTVLVVNQAATVSVLSSSNSDATVGTAIQLTADVVSHSGPAPTGSVQFMDGPSVLGSAALANSAAAFTVSSLTPGTHNLTAVYSGDTDNATSTSAPLQQRMEQIATVTTLGSDADPANAGSIVTFTAIVAMAPGATADGALDGTITFHEGNVVLGTVPINATGQATLSLKTLSVASHAVVATYNGNTNYALSNSTALNEVVQQTATAVSLSTSSALTLMGKPVTFSATVSSSTGVPTGSVTFKDGANVLGTGAIDAHGSTSFTTSALSAGSHTITAQYTGDVNYIASSSSALQQTVTLAQTSLLLAGPTTAVDAGTAARFSAALSTPGVAPTGTVTFLDGAAVLGLAPVSSAGTFPFASANLSVGTHIITASYSGDVNNAAVTSSPVTVLIQQAPTSTSLVVSENPLTQGDGLTLTVALTSDSPNLSGTVRFFDATVLLGTSPLSLNGTATLSVPNLSLGNHPLTAVYSGDVNHAPSTSVITPELVVQRSSISIASSLNPSISGQSVLFTGQITGSPMPTGSAVFRDNGVALGTVTISSSGAASLSVSTLSVGTHSITFTYSGDNNFSVATAQITQSVLNATTATTLSAGANPATYGQPLSLSASVASNGGAATGNVVFTDGSNTIGTAALDANSTAVLTLSNLSPGTHAIIANYAGDGKANPSSSKPLTVVVKQLTTLVVTSDLNPTQTLTPVVLSAKLSNAGATPATGNITLMDGSTTLGIASVDASGQASLTVPQLAAGSHTITATYGGDGADFTSTSATYTLAVQLRPTTTTVTGTATDTSNPQQMTLIAVVRGGGSVPPSGTVNFTAGNITLGAASVDATGVASITINFDTPTQQVVATYPGDASYSGSKSAQTPITAGKPAQFTVNVNVPTVTLVSHQHASVTVTVASVKGFTDTIALGCLGLPYAATCTFDSSQLKLAADGTVTATLLIDTGDPLGAGSSTTAALHSSRNVFACILPASLLLLGFSRKNRRKLTFMVTLLIGISLASGLTGCSGLQVSGTPPGTYTIQVIGTGQGSNTTEAQAVTLVVTQ